MKVSFAVAALLGYIKAMSVQTSSDLSQLAQEGSFMHETNRFFNSADEPIVLAETTGHARIEVYQVPKYTTEHVQAETERIHLSHSKDDV